MIFAVRSLRVHGRLLHGLLTSVSILWRCPRYSFAMKSQRAFCYKPSGVVLLEGTG